MCALVTGSSTQRYHDAPCNQLGGWRDAKPWLGMGYTYLGHFAIVASVWLGPYRGDLLGMMFGILVVLWLAAWWQQVGSRYRWSIVAALFVTVVNLTIWRLGYIPGSTTEALGAG